MEIPELRMTIPDTKKSGYRFTSIIDKAEQRISSLEAR